MANKANSYWENRIQEQLDKSYSRTEEETARELAKIYSQTAEQVRDDILKVYAKVDSLKPGEVIQMNDFYLNKRYWELLDRLNDLLNDLGQEQIRITEPAIIDLYNKAISAIDAEVPKGLIKNQFLNVKRVDGSQALFQSWCLDGKNFSDRVWQDKAKMLAEFKKELNTCIIQGKSPWQAAEKVAARLDVSEANAYRLMRTETAHAQIYAQRQRYKELGFTRARWIASPSCCDRCQEHDGEIYSIDKIANLLPAHPNCRCSFSAVV